MLKKEAEYFGDIVILPFMDRYELVVLKTIAICDFGVLIMMIPYLFKIVYTFSDNSFSHCSFSTHKSDYDSHNIFLSGP